MTGTNRTATFVADGKVVWKAYFDSEGLGTPIPAVPKKVGFVGEWASTEISNRDLTISAVYRPVRVTFLQIDGTSVVKNIGEQYPAPVEIEGCAGEWEPFRVFDCDITVRARYRGPRHRIRLVADGKVFRDIVCPASEFPRLPPVPRKNGFRGRWEQYVPSDDTVIVEAVYEPLRYIFETGIGRTVVVNHGDPFPKAPSRDGRSSRWESRRLASGDCRMSFVFAPAPVLHGFGEFPMEESGLPELSVIPPEHVVEVQDAVDLEQEASVSVPESDESSDSIVPSQEPVVGAPEIQESMFDRDKVRQAVEDLGFISEHWKTIEEDENPGPSLVNSINLVADTPEGTEWEKLVSLLSPLQKEYLSACIGMHEKPQDVLKRHGSTMLIVETGINAIAEDLIGDPLLEEGEVDPDYSNELAGVLKDGN